MSFDTSHFTQEQRMAFSMGYMLACAEQIVALKNQAAAKIANGYQPQATSVDEMIRVHLSIPPGKE